MDNLLIKSNFFKKLYKLMGVLCRTEIGKFIFRIICPTKKVYKKTVHVYGMKSHNDVDLKKLKKIKDIKISKIF